MKSTLIPVVVLIAFVSQRSAQLLDDSLGGPTCPDIYDGTDVYLPSKSNCEEYFHCVDGAPILMHCPDGLYWDQSNEFCNWPDQVSPPCTAECKKPWIRADRVGNCYLFGTEPMNYDDAQQFCTDNGGHLAEPRSKKETKVINNKIEKHAGGESYWIGLTDRRSEGTFVWGSDNTEVTYTNWYKNEPNNLRNEDCVHIRPSRNSEWNDSKCDSKGSSSQGPNTALCQKF